MLFSFYFLLARRMHAFLGLLLSCRTWWTSFVLSLLLGHLAKFKVRIVDFCWFMKLVTSGNLKMHTFVVSVPLLTERFSKISSSLRYGVQIRLQKRRSFILIWLLNISQTKLTTRLLYLLDFLLLRWGLHAHRMLREASIPSCRCFVPAALFIDALQLSPLWWLRRKSRFLQLLWNGWLMKRFSFLNDSWKLTWIKIIYVLL